MCVNELFHRLGRACPQFGEVVCFLSVGYVRMSFDFCIWVVCGGGGIGWCPMVVINNLFMWLSM